MESPASAVRQKHNTAVPRPGTHFRNADSQDRLVPPEPPVPSHYVVQSIMNMKNHVLPPKRDAQERSVELDNAIKNDLLHLLPDTRHANYARTYGIRPVLPSVLVRNGSQIISLPHGLGVSQQSNHLTRVAQKTGSPRSTGSESGSSHFGSDDGQFDSGDGHSVAPSSRDSLDFFRK